MMKKVGQFDDTIISLLHLNINDGTPIYVGESNIEHMKSSHPSDYSKYGADIETILHDPDYVGINPKDGSIEFVKEYLVDNAFVKIAVRVSSGGNYYARSIYALNNNRVNNYIKKGTLKKVKKP